MITRYILFVTAKCAQDVQSLCFFSRRSCFPESRASCFEGGNGSLALRDSNLAPEIK